MRSRDGLVLVVALLGSACGRLGFGSGSPTGADAAGSGFCATSAAATLCDDFDEESTLQLGGWSLFDVKGGAAMTLSSAFAASPPNAVRFDVAATTTSGLIQQATLDFTNSGTTRAVTLDCDLYFATRTTTQIELIGIHAVVPSVGDLYDQLTLFDSAGDTYLEEEQDLTMAFHATTTPIQTLAAASWHHVHVVADYAASTLGVTIDNVVVRSGPRAYASSPGAVTVKVGTSYALAPQDASTIYVDNVALTVQ